MGRETDRQTMEAARAGDDAALRQVLDGIREPAWRLARSYTSDWDKAEDLAQEILIEVVRSLPRLDDASRFAGWWMTLGRRVALRWSELARSPSQDFYERLNQVLIADGFDDFVEALCEPYYETETRVGRPSIPPGTYFRMILVGYFEGLESERAIDWRVSDSLALRPFLGYELTQSTPDHSTLSKTRQRLPVEVHQETFVWILKSLAKAGLLKGKTVAVDATTLEANAALRSLRRRDTGATYEDYLIELAEASGITTPTRQDLAKLDKKRPKKGSNDDWEHPHDPDAKVTKMKDRRTHLAHKSEHTVDLDTQAIVAIGLGDANEGDTSSLSWSLLQASLNLEAVAADPRAASAQLSAVTSDNYVHMNS